jgi:hypothetical protein
MDRCSWIFERCSGETWNVIKDVTNWEGDYNGVIGTTIILSHSPIIEDIRYVIPLPRTITITPLMPHIQYRDPSLAAPTRERSQFNNTTQTRQCPSLLIMETNPTSKSFAISLFRGPAIVRHATCTLLVAVSRVWI